MKITAGLGIIIHIGMPLLVVTVFISKAHSGAAEIVEDQKQVRDASSAAYEDPVSEADGLIARGELIEAEQILQRYVSNKPPDWEPINELPEKIEVYMWTEAEFIKYINYWRREIDKDVNWLLGSYSHAYYFLAYIAMQQGNSQAAVDNIDKGLELEPDHPNLLCEKGYILTSMGLYEDAYQYYLEAYQNRPWATDRQRASALRGMGYQLIELGRLDEAGDKYKESIELEPDNKISRGELEYIKDLKNKVSADSDTEKTLALNSTGSSWPKIDPSDLQSSNLTATVPTNDKQDADFIFQYSGLHIPKQAGEFLFSNEGLSDPTQKLSRACWKDGDVGICFVKSWASPTGTYGPRCIEKRAASTVAKTGNFQGPCTFIKPSASFSAQWIKALQEFSSLGFAPKSDGQEICVHSQRHGVTSPIGYYAATSFIIDDDGEKVPMFLNMYLFHQDGFFCRLSFDYFYTLSKKELDKERAFIRSIKWGSSQNGDKSPVGLMEKEFVGGKDNTIIRFGASKVTIPHHLEGLQFDEVVK